MKIAEIDHPLTSEDVRALRTADRICLDWFERDGETVSQLRCMREIHPADGWEGERTDETYVVPVAAYLTDYAARSTDSGPSDRTSAFAWVHSARFNEYWQTIVKLVRVGDQLRLHWVAGNNNDYARGSDLYHDYVNLEIIRKGKLYLTLFVDNSIGPDNSARMLRSDASVHR